MFAPGAGLYTGSGKDSAAMFDKAESQSVQKEVKEMEIQSERQRQKVRKYIVS